jgi:acyl-CoA thioester hydrolase
MNEMTMQEPSIDHLDSTPRTVDRKAIGSRLYPKTLYVGWGDVDANSHMASAAYLNKCFDVRTMLFAENGFPASEWVRLKIGPVAMRDELEYFKEVELLQEIRVTCALAGLSSDGSRWRVRQEILRPDGRVCARVTSTGGWLDMLSRKLVTPSEAMLSVLNGLERTEDFSVLSSSIKDGSG